MKGIKYGLVSIVAWPMKRFWLPATLANQVYNAKNLDLRSIRYSNECRVSAKHWNPHTYGAYIKSCKCNVDGFQLSKCDGNETV